MADIDAVEAANLAQETSSTLDGSEQIVCFDTAAGKRITFNEVVKWICNNKGSVVRKDITLNSAAANTDVSGYYYKQTVSWSGLTANDVIVDAQVISGSYAYQWMAETAANELRLYFSRQPGSSVKIRIWIDKSTVS